MAVFYVAGYLIEERRRWPVVVFFIRTKYMYNEEKHHCVSGTNNKK